MLTALISIVDVCVGFCCWPAAVVVCGCVSFLSLIREPNDFHRGIVSGK